MVPTVILPASFSLAIVLPSGKVASVLTSVSSVSVVVELSVQAASLQLTSKSLRPLPDKHKGLTDPEARIRARYVDLIIRPEAVYG